jgi:hypothetical protein
MRIRKIVVVGMAAAMLSSGAGLAAASASTAAAAKSGTEHFSLMTTQPSASKYVVIASGLFTAGGVDVSGNKVDLVKLPGGSFKINHGTAVHVLREHLNAKTCLENFAATAKFTLGHGKGVYKGISGSGKALISGLAIARRAKGKCDLNVNPVVSQQTITATAHVSL